MKAQKISISSMMKTFDKELKIRLVADLKLVKGTGMNIANNIKKLEPNTLMIA